jgi:hypothetical protein
MRLLLLITALLPIIGFAQSYSQPAKTAPEFEGGKKAIEKIIHDSITTPTSFLERNNNGSFSFIATLYISEKGAVDSVEIQKIEDDFIRKQLVDIFKSLPNFTPAKDYSGKKGVASTLFNGYFITIDDYVKERAKEYDKILAEQTQKENEANIQKRDSLLKYTNVDRRSKELMMPDDSYETAFLDMDLNFVHSSRLYQHLKKVMRLTETKPAYFSNDNLSATYYYNKIRVKYNFTGEKAGGKYIVKNVTISGDLKTIVDLFVSFWSGTLNFSELKDGVLVTRAVLGEQISLLPSVSASTGTITIRKP